MYRCSIHGWLLQKKCIACAALRYKRQVENGERKPIVHEEKGDHEGTNLPSPLRISIRAIRERRIREERQEGRNMNGCEHWIKRERIVRILKDPEGKGVSTI